MKKLFLLFFIVLNLIGYTQINIVSYNIRYKNSADGINAWPNRVEMVTGLLRFHSADIFGMQEVLYDQILDIEKELPGFGIIGTGRDDGDKAGEFSPVFYSKKMFDLLDFGQFWLSQTPDKPGLGWDAACNRVCTWGKFKLKKSGKVFIFLNTHFDHIGDTARVNSALMIRNFITEKNPGGKLPVILTGDFNLTPDKLPIAIIKKELSDSREVTTDPPYGPEGTFNGFNHDSPLNQRIDYIFVSHKVKVLKYAVLSDSKDSRYPSDHCPVFVKVVFD